ncbi:hypothetical protein M413DRAFT_449100 [Hebeloma cylindrosporum]|uniref:tRNA ligase n=1 Tax=Hebeloma cylindrosporum TaxID=76867 RepID=A0A0C3BIN5_HEBCY|nr:hypothetical protein M413DRAFT_449100 [Hebeloma cylindrosporum h7]
MSGTYNAKNSALIASLVALSAKNPKLVKSTAYEATIDGADAKIQSWKMNEFKYHDVPSPFPTLARGLFTRELDTQGAKKYQIVVRGYDKFFNIGEVPWTTWESLEAHTAAPYILSLKSNGCIIFIAAVTPTQLIVTSKHSMGAVDSSVQSQSMSHAQAGEVWLKQYLTKLGKEEKDMAQELWDKNWTAIAELCDDNFEEHVLGYPPEKTGLHLHGLNVRSRHFITEDPEVVDDFAERWGFIKTPWTTVNTIKEVRTFTDECAARGEWNGEPVEGFVVRTRVADLPNSARGDPARSPYAADSSFFFKVKFDEPYMMYRDWREVTKTLLSSKAYLNPSLLPKSKMKRPETKVYVKWVVNEIKKDPKAFENYTRGKGIIKTRERYLEWLKSDKGEKDLEEEVHKERGSKDFSKTIIVPIAIPGCGKTAVSVALAYIFGFGHTQSDDVQVKKPAPVFIKNVIKLLDKKDVVIADKNNHLKQHRQQLRDAVKSRSVRLLALNWGVVDNPAAIVHRICADRITQRGNNHQTLRVETPPASSSSMAAASKKHEEVLWMFLNTFEELAEGEVDEVVDISLDTDLEAAVRQVVTACVDIIGLPQPSEDNIQEALDAVEAYTVKSKHGKSDNKGKGKSHVRYYALLPEVDISSLLEHHLSGEAVPEAIKEFWTYLKSEKRVVKVPHVTIVHRNNLSGNSAEADWNKELWGHCEELYAMRCSPFFRGKLGSVLCDPEVGVMALTFEDLGLDVPVQKADNGSDGNEGEEAQTFVSMLPRSVRERLHVTIGTSGETKAVEAGEMVKRWRARGRNAVEEVKLQDVFTRGRIQGMQG